MKLVPVGTISSASVFVFSVLSAFNRVVLPELSNPTHTIFAVGGLLFPGLVRYLEIENMNGDFSKF